MFPSNFTFDGTLKKREKKAKNFIQVIWDIVIWPVRPHFIVGTTYLLCSLPSSHFKYKLLSPTFSVRTSNRHDVLE